MRTIIVFMVLTLTGCSNLIIREHDSTMQVTSKVAARTVGCVLTLPFGCMSEWLSMESAKREEGHQAWYNTASYTERQADDDRRAFVGAMALPSLMQSNRQAFQPIVTPSNGYQIVPVPRTLSCQSFTSGQYVNTNCY